MEENQEEEKDGKEKERGQGRLKHGTWGNGIP